MSGTFTALHKLFDIIVNKLFFLAIVSEQRVKIISGKKILKTIWFLRIWYQKFMDRGKNASSSFSLYFPVENKLRSPLRIYNPFPITLISLFHHC